MNYLLMIVASIYLVGCAQLQRGEMQPVKRVDLKDKIYFTTCSGAVENWGSCYSKARSTCDGLFEIVKKYEQPDAGGVTREFTFHCKSN